MVGIVFMSSLDRIGFIGNRIACLDFEAIETKVFDKVTPIGCDINETTNEIFICTKTEVRVLDLATGRVKSIFVNMIEKDLTDEITVFKML